VLLFGERFQARDEVAESNSIEGSCLCGRIRFSTTREALTQLLCYCTDCQTVSGASSYTAYVVPLNSMSLIQGEPKSFDVVADSGRTNSRRFCADCGSRLWAEIEELGVASVNALALEDRTHFQPVANHCTDSAPGWCRVDESLQHIPKT